MLTRKYYKLIRVSYADSDLFRITNISDQTGTLTITNGGGTLKYSLDGVNFETYDFATHPTITVPAGGNLYMKGAKTNPIYNQMKFSMDVNHSIGGNIMSIVDETNYTTMTSMPNNAFYQLFYGDTNLIDVSLLNFGNVTSTGFRSLGNMFQGCTSLVTVADISNITSAGEQSFVHTYYGCTSLTTTPDLSNITSVGSQCFDETFYNCSSLNVAYAPNVSVWGGQKNWLKGVAATGTLYCPSQTVADLIPDNSVDGCPSGWQKVVA